MNFYYVYVLVSQQDGQWYTGFTNNLKTRLNQHQKDRCPSTKDRRPLELIYFEGCKNKGDALAREKYLKSGPGKRYLRNRLKCSQRTTDF